MLVILYGEFPHPKFDPDHAKRKCVDNLHTIVKSVQQ